MHRKEAEGGGQNAHKGDGRRVGMGRRLRLSIL